MTKTLQKSWRALAVEVVVILAVALALGHAQAWFFYGREIFVGEGVAYISVKHAHRFFVRGEGIFLDCRPHEQYAEGHVPGALSLSPSDFDQGRPDLLDYLDPDTMLLLYCTSADCSDSKIVARLLAMYGYRNLNILKDGWDEWVARGFEIEGQP